MFAKLAAASALLAALTLPATALAADLSGEIVTAGTHADLAAQASDLAAVHMHLHHTLNCLVGPKGDGFDPANLNPCAGSGNGAIPDSTDAAKIQQLQTAVTTAEAGIAATDIATAKADAHTVSDQLKAAR
jgi:sulfur carrier protein ThiS